MTLHYREVDSPVGRLKIIASENALVGILWPDDRASRVQLPAAEPHDRHQILNKAITQLHEYFAGTRQKFDLPVSPQGSDFQQAVWRALQQIPYGETDSYKSLAEWIGNPKAVRAVAAANGRNPISIVIPCHRVIGSSGQLTGFAGGLDAKRTLLDLESGALSLPFL